MVCYRGLYNDLAFDISYHSSVIVFLPVIDWKKAAAFVPMMILRTRIIKGSIQGSSSANVGQLHLAILGGNLPNISKE